ncbi:CLUMA_CG000789, isoform A [Clunio marinus]|uniref:CLUMA_CG000789, isoform A n=1 Tax=Clunio marinus TaxID=568069 RepID=A0A1J1HG51_9DIPT|nr:CLUMA_CG000789, isoform A [Clunio marinus]
MSNPAVGVVMFGVSSFANCLRIVVLPELSKPSNTILNSLSDDDLSLRSSESKPCEIFNSNCTLNVKEKCSQKHQLEVVLVD